MIQGIPKQAVAANTLIEGTSFHAKDAANTSASYQWDTKTWDLQDNDAAQSYYDSIARLYASWHVDLIKIDCISSRPYKGEEIRMFHDAVAKTGRPMLISLSPGAAPLNEAVNMQQYSQQWRISDDVWDVWQSPGVFPRVSTTRSPALQNGFRTPAPATGPIMTCFHSANSAHPRAGARHATAA